MSKTIDTAKVEGRREVHFADLDDMLAEAGALTEAESAGKLEHLGNWTLGQTLGHLAAFTNFAYDGFPMKVPFFVKMMTRSMKNQFVKGPMSAGRKIPGVRGGTFGTEPVTTAEGLAKLKAATNRLKAAPPSEPHPLFGKLRYDEWIAMYLRHAELHLSFFRVE